MLFLDTFLNLLGDTFFERIFSAIILITASYFLYRWVLEPVYTALKGMWNFWKMRDKPAVFLEITPPTHSEKSPLATQQLFAILQQFTDEGVVLSVEMTSSRKEGVRYLIRVHPDDAPALQQQIAAYLPEAQFRVLNEPPYSEEAAQHPFRRVYEIKQSRHYAYPLQAHEDLSLSDPVAYIAGAMTKLKPNETITMQLILAPHHSYWTNRIRSAIQSKGYAIVERKWLYFLKTRPLWVWIIAGLYALLTNNIEGTVSLLVLLFIVSLFIRQEEAPLTPAEQKSYEAMLRKLNQPLFRADIRILVTADSNDRLYDMTLGITSSLALLNADFQKLYVPSLHPDWLGQKIGMFKVQHRMPSFFVFDSNILAASELASIFHFPHGDIRTEGMVRSHSRTLAAPLAIKNGEFDVVLGRNNHHGETNAIGLTAKERERHTYIIGGTGNGKTTMLQYAIVQDIKNGKGVAVVDPHGDLAETILRHIPKDRIKDVIYFNPSDVGYPIGLNLLELPANLSGDDLLLAQDFATEAVVSIFRKIFSEDDSGGHRIEFILRNAIHTAFTVEGATLFTVQKLLTNADYRKPIIAKLEDEDLKDFWRNEFGKAGNYQKVKMISGVTAKISRFQRSVAARRILEQVKSTIDFDEILNGKILICNLSKGLVGEDTSEVFGIGILAKLQLAAYRRINMKESERTPFYLYVDEFQNFASPLFMQMLSESRKYKMFLTMAEQSTSQQEERQMVETILANVGTVVVFRSGNPADEEFLLPLFKPYIEEGEIANLSSFNFFMRIMGVKAQEPFSGETIVLESKGNEDIARKVIASSRKDYAKKYQPKAGTLPKTNPKSKIKQTTRTASKEGKPEE